MRKLLCAIAAISSCVLVAGCQATDTVTRDNPNDSLIKNTLVVSEPFDVVWDRTIKNLSENFFVINNVEKASRIINVSFSSTNPAQYIDCGKSTRVFKPGIGADRTYTYENAAANVKYMQPGPVGKLPWLVKSARSLEGRANIYVAPSGNDKTELSTNVRYVFKVDAIAQEASIREEPLGDSTLLPTLMFNFDTAKGKAQTVSDKGDTITCRSLGVLEQQILDAAKPTTF